MSYLAYIVSCLQPVQKLLSKNLLLNKFNNFVCLSVGLRVFFLITFYFLIGSTGLSETLQEFYFEK